MKINESRIMKEDNLDCPECGREGEVRSSYNSTKFICSSCGEFPLKVVVVIGEKVDEDFDYENLAQRNKGFAEMIVGEHPDHFTHIPTSE